VTPQASPSPIGAHSIRARFAAAPPGERAALLREAATDVRASVLRAIGAARMGHIGGDFSVTDILTTLFVGVLRVDPSNPEWEDRDRFILSKGHCAAALYSVLALTGFLPDDLLAKFMAPLGLLNGHPNRKIPGVEANTGPLGHGLPIAVGCAVAGKLVGSQRRVFVVLGDGELQEGSNWEAAMCAAHRKLGQLTAIVDRNRLQQGAGTEETNSLEPLAEKWRAFGWETIEVGGHDHAALHAAFSAAPGDRPRCLIAHTIKGKGASFMENGVEWHHKVPSPQQIAQVLEELGR
jgi:transketolase